MNTQLDPKELADIVLKRSQCSVKVGAILMDAHGIFSWGWNSSGPDGKGECAECHAVKRANKKRLFGAIVYIASRRSRNNKILISRPCEKCQRVLRSNLITSVWRDKNNRWRHEAF